MVKKTTKPVQDHHLSVQRDTPKPFGLWLFAEKTLGDLPKSTKVEPFSFGDVNRRLDDSADRMSASVEVVSNVNLGSASPELAWLVVQIKNLLPFFEASEITSHRDESPSIIYVLSSGRDDPIANAIEGMRHRFPNAAIRVILGEWWSGHRRTQALPIGIAEAYWYQAYDLILPEIAEILESFDHSKDRLIRPTSSNSTPTAHKSIEHFEESEEITGSTLIVSDHSDNRRLWADIGSSIGLKTVGIRGMEELPEGSFSLVVLDNRLDPTTEEVEKIRRAYPKAKMLVGLNFPCWRTVELSLQAGADWFVGKPFQLAGLGRTFSSAALDRR